MVFAKKQTSKKWKRPNYGCFPKSLISDKFLKISTQFWDIDLILYGSLNFKSLQITFSNYGSLNTLNPFSKGRNPLDSVNTLKIHLKSIFILFPLTGGGKGGSGSQWKIPLFFVVVVALPICSFWWPIGSFHFTHLLISFTDLLICIHFRVG